MSSLKENKMGTMPIGRLLLTMALPMALSMLVQALYNVVDSAFVAKISDVNQDALNAVSLAFPVQNIMIGIATGTAVGVNALLSRALGERDADMVNRSALNGVFLAGLGMLLSALFGIFCAELFMRSQTSHEAVIAYGTGYIRIITIASFGIFGEIIFERLLQSTGRTIYTLFTQGTGAVLNIIFDPILIFGLFGLPRMEVAGAAVATVLGQIVAFILAMILNHRKNPDVRLHLRGFRPDWKLIGRILAIGVPSMIMVAIGSVMYYGMNLVLMRFEHVRVGLGEVGTAVFGAYYKLQSFIFMPVFGINNAALAIAAYNYGARFGGGNFGLIAGPCAVESEEQIFTAARQAKAAGVCLLRGGAFKPRTSPYDFSGLGAEGLRLLIAAGHETGLPVVSELMSAAQLDAFADVDVIQIGARNMQNFDLLRALGRSEKPVLLKRGVGATLQELLLSAEYLLAAGNPRVMLCERGIRTFDTFTRGTLDLAAVPALHEMTHLPVLVDPSHAAGRAALVTPLALAAAACGADGVMVEMHPDPLHARCDGAQALLPEELAALSQRLHAVREACR